MLQANGDSEAGRSGYALSSSRFRHYLHAAQGLLQSLIRMLSNDLQCLCRVVAERDEIQQLGCDAGSPRFRGSL